MRELSFLNKGLTISITDERATDEDGKFKKEVFLSKDGFERICQIPG
jgi:DNA gyrase subunit B